VGLARTHERRVELFFRGPELNVKSRVIRQCVEHHTWHRTGGDPVEANRIMLPGVGHFDQVAAFISTELLRNGADADPATAFRRSEPIIELAIQRLRLSDEALLGLAGELVILEGLLDAAPPSSVGEVLSSWCGWRESRRDFELGEVGVEVKTTTRAVSAHRVQGVHQVEPLEGVEDLLVLASIGAQWVPSGNASAFAIPALVDAIGAHVRDAVTDPEATTLIHTFLARLREYGDDGQLGYDHATMATHPVYARPFITRFCRGYDMTDPAIDVLRSDDVLRRQHVESGSVSFAVNLPDRVTGDVNPVVGAQAIAEHILGAAGLISAP
ncbi:MAG: PD-(D/E)XK motif protein, partial [Ornithinimicrobium sp.]